MEVLFLYNADYIHLYLKQMENVLENVENYQQTLNLLYEGEIISDCDSLIELFSELVKFGSNIVFRRFSGKGSLPGLLDTLKQTGSKVDFAPLSIINQNDHSIESYGLIIPPLSMQELPDLYALAATHNIAVAPYTLPDWESKCKTRIAFREVSLPFVYIDDSTKVSGENIDHIQRIFQSIRHEYIFIKENEGFHSGVAVPYYFGPVEDLKNLLNNYASRKIELIIEPFIYQIVEDRLTNELIKVHAFNEIIPTEVLHYHLTFRKDSGKFGERTVEKVDRTTLDTLPDNFPLKRTNELIKKHFPYNMTSMDFIYDKAKDKWVCIDINRSAGSWGEVQEHGGTLSPNIFEKFVNLMIGIEYNEYNDNLEISSTMVPQHPKKSFYMDEQGETTIFTAKSE